jgi:hypothetical protein
LNLLLDTICNVFGGIIFLALLVVITSGQMKPRQTTNDQDQVVMPTRQQLELQLKGLRTERDALRRRLDVLSASADIGPSVGDQELANAIRRGAVLFQELQSRCEAATRELESARRRAEQAREAGKSAQARREAAARARESAERRLAEMDAARAIEVRMPRERATGKREFALAIGHGRLYESCVYSSFGGFLRWNTDEVETDGENLIGLMPQRGTPVRDGPALELRLAGIMRKTNPHRDYICLAVWPDSYAEFVIVRDRLVKAGYEYRLMLITEGGGVSMGGGSGTVQ